MTGGVSAQSVWRVRTAPCKAPKAWTGAAARVFRRPGRRALLPYTPRIIRGPGHSSPPTHPGWRISPLSPPMGHFTSVRGARGAFFRRWCKMAISQSFSPNSRFNCAFSVVACCQAFFKARGSAATPCLVAACTHCCTSRTGKPWRRATAAAFLMSSAS